MNTSMPLCHSSKTDMEMILPIESESYFMNECGTHIRLSIIQGSVFSNAWLASHFSIFMNNEYKIYYGYINDVFRMEYFNDILNSTEINYWSIETSEIINLFINEINNNNYMVVYLRKTSTGNREHLFYGYNLTEQIFYVITLEKGRFREITMTFDEVEQYYSDFRLYNLEHPEGYALVNAQFFPITRLNIRNDYNDDNCYYAVLRSFLHELEGKIYITTDNELNNYEPDNLNKCYAGLSCLLGMKIRLQEYIRDKKFIIKDNILSRLTRELRWNFKKLQDHRKIILSSMEWIVTKFPNKTLYIDEIILKYKDAYSRMEQLSNMSAKFEMTEDWRILDRIIELFDNRYEEEKEILTAFVNELSKLYFEIKLYSNS